MDSKNHYAILGLKQDCYWFEVKKAYRDKVKIHHPDKGGDEVAFKNVDESYKILSNEKKRLDYDVRNSYLDTALKVENLEKKLDLCHIVDGFPLKVIFYKKVFCDCGFDKNCKLCEGGGLREEEVSLILRDTKKYYHGMRIILNNAGSVDKYGRIQSVILTLLFNLPNGFKLIERQNKICYYLQMDIFDFTKSIQNNNFNFSIPNLRNLSIPLDNIEDNNYIVIDDKLDVKLVITINNIKQFNEKFLKQNKQTKGVIMNINDIMNAQIDFDKVEKELEKISALASNQKSKWKPTAGQTKIRLLPYIHRLEFPISVFKFHYKLGKNSWCLSNENKPCPVCDAVKRFSAEGKENAFADQLAKQLRAQDRWFAPVLVRGKEDEGVKIWDFSKTVYEELLGLLKNTEGKIVNIKNGCDIIITYTPAPKGSKQEYAKTKIDIDFQMFTKPAPALVNMQELQSVLESTPRIETIFSQSTASELEDAVKNFIDGQSEDDTVEEVSEKLTTEDSSVVEDSIKPVKSTKTVKSALQSKETTESNSQQLSEDLQSLLDEM